MHRLSRDKDKFGERGRLCIFVGYVLSKKGRKVYDIEKNDFLVSRDVVFSEDVFPYAYNNVSSLPASSVHVVSDEDWILPSIIQARGSSTNDEST